MVRPIDEIIPWQRGGGVDGFYRGLPGEVPGQTPVGEVQTFQDLPDAASVGDIFKVQGTEAGGYHPFYVRRGAGVWEETVKPGLQNRIDADTMPWGLVREADGTFTFAPFDWAPRRAGDEENNPEPTFVGNKINDVFFYQNRLAFLSGENVIFSRTADYGDFFRLTVQDYLDTSPVDVAVSGNSVSLLNYAVPFPTGLMLFAEQEQFKLNIDRVLTPASVSIDPTTHYEASASVRPVAIGPDVYFVSEPGNYAALHEYYVSPETTINTAREVTSHVPRYLPSGVRTLAASSSYDVLYATSEHEPNRIYVYKLFWQGKKKVQAAWSYWELDNDAQVLNLAVVGEWLYLVVNRTEGVSLERLSMETRRQTESLPFNILLDRRTHVTGVYLPSSDITEIELPYSPDKDTFRLVRGSGNGSLSGTEVDPSQYEWRADSLVRVPGDQTGSLYGGQQYAFHYTFSPQFYQNSRGQSVTAGRLQIRSYSVNYIRTAFFETAVDPYGQRIPQVTEVVPSGSSTFSVNTLGSESLRLGTPRVARGSYTFLVAGKGRNAAVTLKNTTHAPCLFQSAEWTGVYHSNSRIR